MIVVFDTVQLFVASKKRYRKADPPHGDQKKSNAHGHVHGNSQRFVKENEGKADQKRDTASDISPGVAAGGNFVHPLFGGDVSEHGVIEDQAQRVRCLCKYKNQQKPDPGA